MKKTRAASSTPTPSAEPERARTDDQAEQDYTTFDCLAFYVVNHLEDAASDDDAGRRRFGRLVGLLAEHAERAYARRYPR